MITGMVNYQIERQRHINLKLPNPTTSYNSSFTAGGLLHPEFLALEPIIREENILELLDREENENEYIAIKTLGARKRIIPQLKARIRTVNPGFWDEFYLWRDHEQRLGLLYVSLKTYRILFEIHWEVILPKFRTGDKLDAYSVTMFLDELASRNEEVGSWSKETLDKVNSRYRKALNDAGLLQNSRLIRPAGIDETFWEYFRSINEHWFLEACFMQ